MRKLIDAEKLKELARVVYEAETLAGICVLIDTMPDAGCAREQRTTQYCREVLDMRNAMLAVVARLEAESGYRSMFYEEGMIYAVGEIRKALGVEGEG